MALVIIDAGARGVAVMLLQAVDSALRGASISWIDWYRREISPHKGFACAHRVRYGGESCSQFARQAFETRGWWPGVRAIVVHLRLCGEAARDLRRGRARLQANRVHDQYLDGDPNLSKSSDDLDATGLAGNGLEGECKRCCLQGCINGCVAATLGSLLTIFLRI